MPAHRLWCGRMRTPAELFDVSDKVVVVTGGSRGIGEMIAAGFVAGGARVYISSRKADACEALAAELTAQATTGGSCHPAPADLSTLEGVTQLVDTVGSSERRVDVLVNNAGVTWGAPLEEYPDEAFDRVFALNVKSVFHTTVKFLPLLRAAANPTGPARVINIGSIEGITVPEWENYAYPASKAAVHNLTRVLAHRMAVQQESITVNAVAPGPFPSKMTAFVADDPGANAEIAKLVPLRRWGEPDDIAGACIYLASAAGAYVTGVVLPVDGGISAHG
jgi:NAD(P)-dependent dehydrogenase (short-subunit alcohol dehydrogenase family)